MQNIVRITPNRDIINISNQPSLGDFYIYEEQANQLKYDCTFYNFEIDIINKILSDQTGIFDFDKNMIDIGSFIGFYTWGLPFKYNYCFEPNQKSGTMLCMNMYIRGRENFIYYNQLLSDTHEIIDYDGYHTGALSEDYCEYIGAKKQSRSTMILDDFIDEIENVGFIKIDAEGMDGKILQGGTNLIKKHNYPPILFELWLPGHPWMDHDFDKKFVERYSLIFNFAQNNGYDIIWNWGNYETHLMIHK